MIKLELGDSIVYIPKDKVLYIKTHETDTNGYVWNHTYHIDFWVSDNQKISWKTYKKQEYEDKLKEVLGNE